MMKTKKTKTKTKNEPQLPTGFSADPNHSLEAEVTAQLQNLQTPPLSEQSPDATGSTKPSDFSSENIKESLHWAFGLLAGVPYDHLAKQDSIWTLRDDERKNLGRAAIVLCDRYIPGLIDAHPELATVLLVNALVIVPRVMLIRKRNQDAENRDLRQSGNGEVPISADDLRRRATGDLGRSDPNSSTSGMGSGA